MEDDQQDAGLRARARDGDPDAFEALADRHGPLGFRVALRLLDNRSDAQDIAQDALLAAWQELPALPATRGFPAWLRQIVTRQALDRMTRSPATSPSLATGPGRPDQREAR